MSADLRFAEHYAEVRLRLYGRPKRMTRPVPAPPEPIEELDKPEKIGGYIPIRGGQRWREIVNEVAEKYDMPAQDILSRARPRRLIVPRFECWYRIRSEITIGGKMVPLPVMARWLDRDHSTILHGIRKHCADNGLEYPR